MNKYSYHSPNPDWEFAGYRIVWDNGRAKLLGPGGAGATYLAINQEHAHAALKLMKPETEGRNRLLQEAAALRRLDGEPTIIPYIASGRASDGMPAYLLTR